MKKFLIITSFALLILPLSACSNNAPSPEEQAEITSNIEVHNQIGSKTHQLGVSVRELKEKLALESAENPMDQDELNSKYENIFQESENLRKLVQNEYKFENSIKTEFNSNYLPALNKILAHIKSMAEAENRSENNNEMQNNLNTNYEEYYAAHNKFIETLNSNSNY